MKKTAALPRLKTYQSETEKTKTIIKKISQIFSMSTVFDNIMLDSRDFGESNQDFRPYRK